MDNSGLFSDFNFKLVVIEALLDKEPLFAAELNAFTQPYTDRFEWYAEDSEPIIEIIQYLENLPLSIDDLHKIDSLCFDGGNAIYHIIKPDWDGEDELFDIESVAGFEVLKNLKTVDYIALCDPNVLKPLQEAGIDIQ